MLWGIFITINIQHLADVSPFSVRQEPTIALKLVELFRRGGLVHWKRVSLEVGISHADCRIARFLGIKCLENRCLFREQDNEGKRRFK